MAIQELAPGSGRFSASDSSVAGNGASACNDPCAPGEDYSTAVGNGSWDNVIHPTRLVGVRGWAES
jgi:hypothetical protein